MFCTHKAYLQKTRRCSDTLVHDHACDRGMQTFRRTCCKNNDAVRREQNDDVDEVTVAQRMKHHTLHRDTVACHQSGLVAHAD